MELKEIIWRSIKQMISRNAERIREENFSSVRRQNIRADERRERSEKTLHKMEGAINTLRIWISWNYDVQTRS
jgi:hypothetical protein